MRRVPPSRRFETLAGEPEFDPAGCVRVDGRLVSWRPIDLGDEGRVVPFQKTENAVFRCGEGVCELRVGRVADHDKQRDTALDDRREFIGFVADAAVVGDGYPTALADFFQPGRIRAIVREVIRMAFDMQTRSGQDFRKAFSEVAVGEENAAHAARS